MINDDNDDHDDHGEGHHVVKTMRKSLEGRKRIRFSFITHSIVGFMDYFCCCINKKCDWFKRNKRKIEMFDAAVEKLN